MVCMYDDELERSVYVKGKERKFKKKRGKPKKRGSRIGNRSRRV